MNHELNGNGFSIIFDEYTSLRNHSCANINLHLEIVRIIVSLPLVKCVESLSDKLNNYGLSMEKNIFCLINEGSIVMPKVGKLVLAPQ